MRFALPFMAIGCLTMAASPAAAEDWWLLSGAPGDPAAIFADVDTLARQGQAAQMRVLRIDRHGRSYTTMQQIRCDTISAAPEIENVRQFACVSSKQREQHGLLLAAMAPALVARMIFATGPTVTATKNSADRVSL